MQAPHTPSPPRAMFDRLERCLVENPFAIAGLANWPIEDEQLFQTCRKSVADVLRSGSSLPPPRSAVIYALVRVAQEEYGADGHQFWGNVADRLDLGPLAQWQQELVGRWFREAVQHYDYAIPTVGRKNVEPILWHAGCPQNNVRKLIEFVRDQVSQYGERATEADAVHALRLGDAAGHASPPLPATVRRLFEKSPDGMEQIWSALAGAVYAYQRGGAGEAQRAWIDLPGIPLDLVLSVLASESISLGCGTTARRPQLRYDHETGAVQLWLSEGQFADWEIVGLHCRAEESSWRVLPPLPQQFQIVHKATGQQWIESLLVPGRPSIWFHGRSGVLDRGEAVAARGLTCGTWHVLLRGAPVCLPVEHRLPLELSFFKGGSEWSAWEVVVPPRASGAETKPFVVRVCNSDWPFALARGVWSSVAASKPLHRAKLDDGSPVDVYSERPTLSAEVVTVVRILKIETNGARIVNPELTVGGQLPDLGPGVYRVQQTRGGNRSLLDYAVIPDFRVSLPQYESDRARLQVFAGRSGVIVESGNAISPWELEQPDVEPWLVGTWKWNDGISPDLRMRWPVQAVRWRIESEVEDEPWCRVPLVLDRRDVAAKQTRIEIEIPEVADARVNGAEVPPETFQRTATGHRFTIKPAAYTLDDSLNLRVSGNDWTIAWLTELPVLREFAATVCEGRLFLQWNALHLPTKVCVQVWDPEAVGAEPTKLPIGTDTHAKGRAEIPLNIDDSNCGWISVAFGVEIAQGFARREFVPGHLSGGGRATVLVQWNDKPRIGHDWAKLLHRWSAAARFDRVPTTGIIAGLNNMGESIQWAAVRDYYRALGPLNQGPGWRALRIDLGQSLRYAWHEAATELAQSLDQSKAVRDWLAVRVHPGWCDPRLLLSENDETSGYPAAYFAALAVLNDPKASVESRTDAAFDIWEFHSSHSLFSPSLALPLVKATYHSGEGLYTEPGSVHHHQLIPSPGPWTDDLSRFKLLCMGQDAYLEFGAGSDDKYPKSSDAVSHNARHDMHGRNRTNCVFYAPTRYSAGWNERKRIWQVDRHQWDTKIGRPCAQNCCDNCGPLFCAPWSAVKLFQHLKLENWLRKRAAGLTVKLPRLPVAFDEFLFNSLFGAVHERVLKPAPRSTRVVLGQSIVLPDYEDFPDAARIAWRLAWLDRLGYELSSDGTPSYCPTIADWSPFFDILSKALSIGGEFADLLTSCLGVAAYVKAIMEGGLGPAFRFEQ